MKPLIFVSHTHASGALAAALKTEISRLLLDGAEFFVSSDRSSIVGGDRWLDKINMALSRAAIVLVLCDPTSVLRPWVNFEAGGAWVSKKRVIPLCFGGMTPRDLPQPLASLQALDLARGDDLHDLVKLIAQEAGLTAPDFDGDQLVTRFQEALSREPESIQQESPPELHETPETVSVILKSYEQDFFDDVYEHDSRDNARHRVDEEEARLSGEYRALLASKFGPKNVSLRYSRLEFPGGTIRMHRKEELLSSGHESSVWLEIEIQVAFDDLETMNLLQDRKPERWRKALRSAFRYARQLDLEGIAQNLHERGVKLSEYGESHLVLDAKEQVGFKVGLRTAKDGIEVELIDREIAIADAQATIARVADFLGLHEFFKDDERLSEKGSAG